MSPLRGVRQPVRMSNAALLLVPRLAARIETNMIEFWFHLSGSAPMPTTLTLKNIPDEIYARLKTAAALHRRSLNSEAIVCLEPVLTPGRLAPGERLARARALRAGLQAGGFGAQDIDTMKRAGRA